MGARLRQRTDDGQERLCTVTAYDPPAVFACEMDPAMYDLSVRYEIEPIAPR